jgi:hypothetical protein
MQIKNLAGSIVKRMLLTSGNMRDGIGKRIVLILRNIIKSIVKSIGKRIVIVSMNTGGSGLQWIVPGTDLLTAGASANGTANIQKLCKNLYSTY